MWIRKQALPGGGLHSTAVLSNSEALGEESDVFKPQSVYPYLDIQILPLMVIDRKNEVVYMEGLTQCGERANEPRKRLQLSHPRFANDD